MDPYDTTVPSIDWLSEVFNVKLNPDKYHQHKRIIRGSSYHAFRPEAVPYEQTSWSSSILTSLGYQPPGRSSLHGFEEGEGEGPLVIINPLTGSIFTNLDERCPLVDVDLILSQDNVWANIQQKKHVSELNFNLSNRECWKPFFDEAYQDPDGHVQSIQVLSLSFWTNNSSSFFSLIFKPIFKA